jgi:hypothetical protein
MGWPSKCMSMILILKSVSFAYEWTKPLVRGDILTSPFLTTEDCCRWLSPTISGKITRVLDAKSKKSQRDSNSCRRYNGGLLGLCHPSCFPTGVGFGRCNPLTIQGIWTMCCGSLFHDIMKTPRVELNWCSCLDGWKNLSEGGLTRMKSKILGCTPMYRWCSCQRKEVGGGSWNRSDVDGLGTSHL